MAASPDEIRAGLAEILNEVADVNADDVSDEKSFTDDLDVDSLSMVEVAMAAEEKFGVKIPDDELPSSRPSATPSATSVQRLSQHHSVQRRTRRMASNRRGRGHRLGRHDAAGRRCGDVLGRAVEGAGRRADDARTGLPT